MKLVFEMQGKLFNVLVDQERSVSFSSELTNNKWLAFRELAMKEDNQEEVRLAEEIIKCLPSEELVEKYIISEFSKFGLAHIKTE